MTRTTSQGCTAFLAALLLAGCASAPPRSAETAECRDFYDELDRVVDANGMRDEGAFRVPGYPYLRADRLMASFADEADDDRRFMLWLNYLRHRDLDSRAVEIANLGIDNAAALMQTAENCSEKLARLELAGPEQRLRLRQRVRVPDDYSLLARTVGLYPVAVPFLNLGINRFNRGVLEDYATPLEAPGDGVSLVAWFPDGRRGPREQAERIVREAPRNALGMPEFDPGEWWQLAMHHAPVWWIETGGLYDRPGMPLLQPEGPGLDASQPLTFFKPSYTRFGKQVLPALVYTIWFSERPPQQSLDSYAGALDGVIWRVTLDPQGRPLVYDTIHTCGCYRYYFMAQPLQRIGRGGFWQEPVLFPQQEIPEPPLALRLQTQTHYLQRVVPESAVDGLPRSYGFATYEVLLTLPAPEGGTRSLFGRRGLVEGTERLERYWLWPAGVRSPGAMRQWGRHATSFVGRSHFDDARFLEQNFEVPEWAQ
jgi:hypothetical protein